MHTTLMKLSLTISCLMMLDFSLSAGPMAKVDSAGVNKGTVGDGSRKSVKPASIVKNTGPMIKVDSTDFDMGVIMEGERKSMKHTFIVKNTGTDTLLIQKVKPG